MESDVCEKHSMIIIVYVVFFLEMLGYTWTRLARFAILE